jgi:dihydrodipicolinate synthase/N-acetylneuraminate lyase
MRSPRTLPLQGGGVSEGIQERLRGSLVPAVPVPRTASGRLHEAAQESYAAYMAEQPVAGVAVWVHTGRGPYLDRETRSRVLRSWRQAMGPGRPVIAGAGALPQTPDYDRAAARMAAEAADGGADALLAFPPVAHRGDRDRIVAYHRSLAEVGLPLLLFYLYEAAGGVTYDRETLRDLFALPGVAGIKMATLDSVMTFQDVAALIRSEYPGMLLITGEDRFLGYSLLCGAEGALIGMGAALPGPQAALLRAHLAGEDAAFLRLTRAVDAFAQATFRAPMEGYIRRMLWALADTGVLPEEATHDPHGPELPAWEREDVRRATRAFADSLRVPPEAARLRATRTLIARGVTSSTTFAKELPERPRLSDAERRQVTVDAERYANAMPADPAAVIRETYGLEIAAEYAGRPIKNPFGKASGQLSLNRRQVRRDAEGGLGFVVLKTVIAQDETGDQSMAAWAIPATRMRVERIRGADGTEGWTVTWKGRGWSESFDAYLALLREAAAIGAEAGMVVAPSVKYHLPGPGEGPFREGEYRHTTRALQAAWAAVDPGPMPLEKDFSPTLAGDDRSREQAQILAWLTEVPGLIRAAATGPGVTLGVKVMNARFDDAFQLAMLRAVSERPQPPPDFLVYANRLFDPEREFEGTRGVAYGGPDLSARNLRGLDLWRAAGGPTLPISATGDILTGRRAMEYALRGASSCQMHTLFQLPDTEFAARTRNKSAAVLHHLLFHPESGLIPWMLHLRRLAGRDRLAWLELPGLARERASSRGND